MTRVHCGWIDGLWCTVLCLNVDSNLSYCRDSVRRLSLRRSRSFKVIDVSTSWKRVCDFLL